MVVVVSWRCGGVGCLSVFGYDICCLRLLYTVSLGVGGFIRCVGYFGGFEWVFLSSLSRRRWVALLGWEISWFRRDRVVFFLLEEEGVME